MEAAQITHLMAWMRLCLFGFQEVQRRFPHLQNIPSYCLMHSAAAAAAAAPAPAAEAAGVATALLHC